MRDLVNYGLQNFNTTKLLLSTIPLIRKLFLEAPSSYYTYCLRIRNYAQNLLETGNCDAADFLLTMADARNDSVDLSVIQF